MKKQILALFTAMTLTASLTACGTPQSQPTQPISQPAPTEAAVQETTQATVLSYAHPDRFTGSWTGLNDTFTVHADALITLPDITKLCTATVERRDFTQEEADKMLSVLMEGNTLYQEVLYTKQSLQAEIDDFEAMLRGEIPYPADGDGSLERVPSLIENRKLLMETAPNEGEVPLADTTFHNTQSPDAVGTWDSLGIVGYANVNGTKIHARIENDHETNPSATFWRGGYGNMDRVRIVDLTAPGYGSIQDAKINPTISEAAAKELGDAIIQKLGLNFTLDTMTPVVVSKVGYEFFEQGADGKPHLLPDLENGYRLVYVRTVNGLPLTKTNFDAHASAEQNPAPGWFPYESIKITVNEKGMLNFFWDGPYSEPQIQETSVELMPFDEIQEIFSKMFFVQNSYWLDKAVRAGANYIHTVNIGEVKLNLMRVRDAHTLGPGTIVPVWDFWGTDDWYLDDPAYASDDSQPADYQVLMTINALDGTIYNRELGY